MHRGNIITKEKEDDDMSAYVKPIQATPTLSGKDALDIVKQVLRTPSPESIDKKKKMLEARKRLESILLMFSWMYDSSALAHPWNL